jgi:hypothetical protein
MGTFFLIENLAQFANESEVEGSKRNSQPTTLLNVDLSSGQQIKYISRKNPINLTSWDKSLS